MKTSMTSRVPDFLKLLTSVLLLLVMANPFHLSAAQSPDLQRVEALACLQQQMDYQSALNACRNSDLQVATAILGGEALFEHNSDKLSSAGVESLARLVGKLDSYQEIIAVKILGHTDSVGSANYNLQLSTRRAEYIRLQMKQLLPDAHINSMGLGETTPIADNETEEGRKRNRRVEILVVVNGVVANQ